MTTRTRFALSSALTLAAGAACYGLDLDCLRGTFGFALESTDVTGLADVAFASGGDLNADGFADFVVSSGAHDSVYVIFGEDGIAPSGRVMLADLDGSNGFVINGVAGSETGESVSSAGDVNGDGVADLLVSAWNTNQMGVPGAGACYVIFGGATLGAGGSLDLASLNGANGFVVHGSSDYHHIGTEVSIVDDLNGDAHSEIVVAASFGDPGGRADAGQTYVLFGGVGVGAGGAIDVSTLNGTNGFVINGVNSADESGESLASVGDVNDDGVSDLLIGASLADPNGESSGGETYVIFGTPGIGASGAVELAALDGTDGFVLLGEAAGDRSGSALAAAGDVNNDGVADLLIGAPQADSASDPRAGRCYVVFGGNAIGSGGSVELAGLDGTNGFTVSGEGAQNRLGKSVAAGDFNGDGVSDIALGAVGSRPGGLFDAGATYVLYGQPGLGSGGAVDLGTLESADGFRINGVEADKKSGWALSSLGDVNGDGYGDLAVGLTPADEAYVVYGGDVNSQYAAGDLDRSGCVNSADLASILAGWGSIAADVNDDGVTDATDLAIVLASWTN